MAKKSRCKREKSPMPRRCPVCGERNLIMMVGTLKERSHLLPSKCVVTTYCVHLTNEIPFEQVRMCLSHPGSRHPELKFSMTDFEALMLGAGLLDAGKAVKPEYAELLRNHPVVKRGARVRP